MLALEAPLKATLVPAPAARGLIIPEILQVGGGGPELAARTSQMVKLKRSVVGAVSLMRTVVPLTVVGALWI